MKTRFLTVAGVILVAAATRLLPHPYNFTPIAAMALFGGAHLRSRVSAFAVPILAMLLSDVVIGFHSQMPAVYLSFILITLLGRWLSHRRTISRVAGVCVASSLLFFFISNFGVWALDSLYPKTAQGLAACYLAALPFLQNTALGDAIYTAVLFGGFAFAERRLPFLREPLREPMIASV